MKDLRIDNPCPVQMNRFSKSGCDFYCKSCQSKVVDFRGQSDAYLAAHLNSETCGVFDPEQLEGQRPMKGYKKVLFYGLTVISFLGWNVRPLNAQTPDSTKIIQTQKASAEIDKERQTKADHKVREAKQKRHLFRRRKKSAKLKGRTSIGCPSF